MRKIDVRLVIGGLLIVFGGLMLLQQLGLIREASDLFWGVLFLVGAAGFLYVFGSAPSTAWWAVIPAFTLAGLGVTILLPAAYAGWGGFAFLATLGMSFFVVYATGRERWWALIPGGVLVTLGTVAVLSEQFNVSDGLTGGIFFVGLGLTFLLVALLPTGGARMDWAYIPAAGLLILGLLTWTPFVGLIDYIWPVVLVVAGGLMIFRFFRSQEG